MVRSAALAPVPETRSRSIYGRGVGAAFNIDWRRGGGYDHNRRNGPVNIRRIRPVGCWCVVNRRRSKPYPYRRTVDMAVWAIVSRTVNGGLQRPVCGRVKASSDGWYCRALHRRMHPGSRARSQWRSSLLPGLCMRGRSARERQHHYPATNPDRRNHSVQSSHLAVPTISSHSSKQRWQCYPRIPSRLTAVTASYNTDLTA